MPQARTAQVGAAAASRRGAEHPVKDCNQCGKCCIKYGKGALSASPDEIRWWETFRPEIFSHVGDGEIWVDPNTGQRLEQCPWLRKQPGREMYSCEIYHDRPDDCRHYPVTVEQMVEDECEMLELRDLTNPQQAQQRLDKIMSDSRPPYQGESHQT
jgi:Fe-S-cluster containining protein